jgi:hypothetical protein
MPEVTAPPSPPATPPTPTDGLYAGGKIKGPEALEKATREITTKLELPPLPEGPLFGDGKAFKDVMALEADYLSKEKLLGRLGNTKPPETPAAPAPKPADPPKPGQMPTIPDPAQEADDDTDFAGIVKSAGLDMETLEKTWDEKGELLPEHYKALKAKGYGKKVVNEIAQNAKITKTTLVTQTLSQLDEIAGGTDARENMLKWAGSFYKGQELDAVRRGIQTVGSAVQTMKQIAFDFHKNAPGAGTRPLISGGTPPPAPAVGPYTDPKEYLAVQNKKGQWTPEETARYQATNPNILLKM